MYEKPRWNINLRKWRERNGLVTQEWTDYVNSTRTQFIIVTLVIGILFWFSGYFWGK